MSCKYCNLKRRKDGDVEWLAGEEWGSESDDGGYICPHDNGFRMLVYYDARCACAVVDDIKYCPFCGSGLTMPVEPLIEDEKARKVFREWADLFGAKSFRVNHWGPPKTTLIESTDLIAEPTIELPGHIGKDSEIYTITELCGKERECER